MDVQDDLTQYAPDGKEQQAAVSAIAAEDAFNWGYDPVHYSTPEGSYATDPDGPTRCCSACCRQDEMQDSHVCQSMCAASFNCSRDEGLGTHFGRP